MIRLLVPAVACLLVAQPAVAYDQSFCAPLDTATQRLAEQGESIVAWYRDGEMVKGLFGDRQSGAWTLVALDATGRVCTMRSGTGLVAPEGEPA